MNIECSNQMDTNGHSILFSDQNKKKRIQRRRSLLNYFKLKFKTPAKPRRDFHEKMTDQQSEIRRSFINSPSYISFVLYIFFSKLAASFWKKKQEEKKRFILLFETYGIWWRSGNRQRRAGRASSLELEWKKTKPKQNKILYVIYKKRSGESSQRGKGKC